MLVLIVILLVLAAIFGVLGTVLKVTFVLIASALLALLTLAAFGYYWFRHRVRELQRQTQRSGTPPAVTPPSSTIEVGEPVRDDRAND